VAPGTPTTLVFAALYEGDFDDYFDFAPEPGAAPFPFTAGSLTPPPPPPVAPAPIAPTGTGGPFSARPGAPLSVRSFGLSTTRSAVRMRLGWVKGEGRVTWDLTLKARVDGRLSSKHLRGGGKAGSRSVTRTIRVPATWKGATISARLKVKNGSRLITRTRTVRL
jgi:hypothetical protein